MRRLVQIPSNERRWISWRLGERRGNSILGNSKYMVRQQELFCASSFKEM
jgi:hypothetical protein